MKKQLFAATAFIACMALLASSCVKESSTGENVRPAGTKISFSVTTGYETGNGTRAIFNETRTVYSGSVTNSIERIDWVSGDKIKIRYLNGASSGSLSEVGWGNYSVNNISNQTASISHAGGTDDGNDLEWGANSQNKFYGVYPSSAGLASDGVVTGTIPATQTLTYSNGKYLPQMDCAYMVAYADNDQISNGVVTLPFTPVVTAYEFKLRFDANATTPSLGISEIQLKASESGESLSGDFRAQISNYDSNNSVVTWNNATATGNNGTTITAVIPSGNGNPNLSKTTDLDFTVFALPMDISQLTLRIKYTNNTVKSIPLKKGDAWVSFAAGQKHVISNYSVPDEQGWQFSVEPIASQTVQGHSTYTWSNISVVSKKTSAASGSVENVNWKVQYWNGSTWADGNPPNYTITKNSGNNSFNVALTSASSSGYDNTITSFDASTKLLQQATAKGNSTTPYDLSRDDGTANAGTSSGTCRTANCYVVSAPGVYKFPVVYGNAINNPQSATDYNWSAFAPFVSTAGITGTSGPDGTSLTQLKQVHIHYNLRDGRQVQTYYLPQFYNAACDGIDHPFVFEDLKNLSGTTCTVSSQDAVVLWQSSENIIRANSVSLTDSDNFIQFEITKEDIKPGNVVIAAKCTVNDGNTNKLTDNIVWSWHIWITDKNLSPSSSFMPVNLGFVEDNNIHQNAVTKYPDRTKTFRVIQTDSQGNILSSTSDPTTGVFREFTLTQEGDVVSNSSTVGTNTYYQWGRKDPFSSTSGSNSNPGDNGAGIRAPQTLFSAYDSNLDVSTCSWLSGSSTWKVYPFFYYDGTYHWFFNDGKYRRGPFTYAEATNYINYCPHYNPLAGAGWRTSGSDFYIIDSIEEYYGPYEQAEANNLANAGFSAGFGNSTDIYGTTNKVYTSQQRWQASIPLNLWNAYIYSETPGSPYDNKFKTIYDPCPVGFTVPTKNQLNVTNYSSGNYWTDHPCMIKLTDGANAFAISSYYDYDKAFSKSSESTATKTTRSTAASIRPMVDPKY